MVEGEKSQTADCSEFEIWNVPSGSKYCAQSSAKEGDTPSDDYDAGVRIVQPGGGAVDWAKRDLDPGPACLSPLQAGGYGSKAKLVSGPSGSTVTLRAWIEAPNGSRPFDCTWTNSDAGTVFDVVIAIVVRA
jgi:hypothetical protein